MFVALVAQNFARFIRSISFYTNMAPSAVFAQARKAATNGLKRKRTEAEPDDEVASENESEQSDEVNSDEVDSDEENEDDDDEEDDDDAEEADDLPVFSRLEKGKDRSNGIDAEHATVKGAGSKPAFRQKTLILSSRGITHRMRHMMKDLASLLPHSKTGAGISHFASSTTTDAFALTRR